jgi:hypothetical protein
MRNLMFSVIAGLALAGCVTAYTLVSPDHPIAVSKGTMKVRPTTAWNKAPGGVYNIPQEENWTQNGPVLDSITFIGGLKDGRAIAKQRPKDDRKVPVFRAAMTPQDLISMVESYYRIKSGAQVFETVGVAPGTLAGKPAVQFDYRYVAEDEVKRRGRSMIAVVNGKLYLMSLDGTAVHYFDAALPEFELLAASATIS